MFLMKQWGKNSKMDIYWTFIEAGHGKTTQGYNSL